jgi:protein-S-isoprenylcysteine O-methyltransferase Ste14
MLDSTIISIIFLLCWGAFFLTWISGALYNVLSGPEILRRGIKPRRWLLIGIIAILLTRLLANYTGNSYAGSVPALTVNVPELQVIGAILLIIATLFTLWSRIVLGNMWSSVAAVKSGHQLRTDGPYRVTRHPIYTGMLGMLAGTALVYLVALPILILSLVVFLNKIAEEEQLMAQQFGEQYAEYKHRVPQLIPGFRGRKKR